MFKHKIFNLLSTFSPEEIRNFGYFISSPYFNGKRSLDALYSEIVKSYPEFTNRRLGKHRLYKKILGRPEYKDSTMRNLFANLVILAEEFLAIQNFERDKLMQKNCLLKELLVRDQVRLNAKEVKKIDFDLKKTMKLDYNYLYNRSQVEKNLYNFNTLHDKIISKSRIAYQIEKLGNFGIYLTAYFVIEVISLYFNIFVYAEKYNAEEIPAYKFICDVLKAFNLEANIKKTYEAVRNRIECDFVFELYLALYSAFSKFANIENYYTYKNLVNKYISSLSKNELSFHYSIMVSYCIIKAKEVKYKDTFREELLELYIQMLEKKYYITENSRYLPESLFRDILFHSIKLEKFDLVEELIDKYCKEIEPKKRFNMFNFANAFNHYEKGDCIASLKCLNSIKLDYFIYKYDVKNLMLKIYYDLDYCEEILDLIHSYRELLRKDKFLSPYRKRRHKNFITILRSLTLIKAGFSNDDKDSIREKILSSEATYKSWLLEKVNE